MTVGVEVKEIIQDYVLITYDIPAKEKKLRAKFLKEAKAIGAESDTASVYLIPYSEKAMELASQLQSAGHASVWGPAHQPNKEKAIEKTIKYGDHIQIRCQVIEQRLAISQNHIVSGELGVALKMGIKTGRLLKQLAQIQESYNPDWFKSKLEELVMKWKEIYGGTIGKQG